MIALIIIVLIVIAFVKALYSSSGKWE